MNGNMYELIAQLLRDPREDAAEKMAEHFSRPSVSDWTRKHTVTLNLADGLAIHLTNSGNGETVTRGSFTGASRRRLVDVHTFEFEGFIEDRFFGRVGLDSAQIVYTITADHDQSNVEGIADTDTKLSATFTYVMNGERQTITITSEASAYPNSEESRQFCDNCGEYHDIVKYSADTYDHATVRNGGWCGGRVFTLTDDMVVIE